MVPPPPKESAPFLGDKDNCDGLICIAFEIEVQHSVSWLRFLLGFKLSYLKKCAWVLVRQVVKIATVSHVILLN